MLKLVEERRRMPRKPFGQMAAIVVKQGAEPRGCFVIDVSDSGVQLHMNGVDVSDVFALLFRPDGPSLSGNYQVVWREGPILGAKFIGAAPPEV
jgi:hypothetical protein